MLLLLLPFCVSAQKAYDAINYKGTLQGKIIRLYLGNGYVAASRITISVPKQKSISFLSESGVTDEKFILRNTQKESKDYFILYRIQESYSEAPKIIIGLYQSLNKAIAVKFYRIK